MLGGISFSYIQLFGGSVKLDGQSADWDSGQRFELQFRDYYFKQRTNHPFFEIGLLLEEHEASGQGIKLDAETWAFKMAVGSAIPMWNNPDRSMIAGLAPQVGMHLGQITMDVDRSDAVNTAHSKDKTFRYGFSAGLDGWMLFNRSVTTGIGLFSSYWRSQEITLTVPTTGASRTSKPTGWDLGIRFQVGVVF